MHIIWVFALNVCVAFLLHFIADFLLQSREMGQKKSSDNEYLLLHIVIIFAVMFFGLIPLLGVKIAVMFSFINAMIHGAIDKNIWNLYKFYAWTCLKKQAREQGARKDQIEDQAKKLSKDWKYWEDHWFYSTIGLDQLLHAVTIVIVMAMVMTCV